MPKSVFSKNYAALLELLAAARTERGITQTVLAARLGKPQSFVAKIEGGERRLDVIELLAFADALNLDALELVEQLSRRVVRPIVI